MTSVIRLVVGLGNPGGNYIDTRHNSGEHFVRLLAKQLRCDDLRSDARFFAEIGTVDFLGRDLHLLIPTTFMNESGRAVAGYTNFFKILPEELLVVHDDMDIPVGQTRIKIGGGDGGHNGLRNIISCVGKKNATFHRLRIGIGRPKDSDQVTTHVLSKSSPEEKEKINSAIDNAIHLICPLLEGKTEEAMSKLHSTLAIEKASSENL